MNPDTRDFPRDLAALARWREAQRNSLPSVARRSSDTADVVDAFLTFLSEGCDDGSLAARALALVFRLSPQRVEWPGVENRCGLRPGQWEAALRAVDSALPAARLNVRGERVRWTRAELKRARRELLMERAAIAQSRSSKRRKEVELAEARVDARRKRVEAVEEQRLRTGLARGAAALWTARLEALRTYRVVRFVEKRTGATAVAAAEMREFDRKLGIGGPAA